jgi:hypothetical protein
MSGFLGALLGGSNQGGPGQSTAIANVLQQVLSQNGGGIATLISRFTDAHVDRVFTQDEIANWASQAGTDPDKMRAVLAEALPHAMDHVTPNGETQCDARLIVADPSFHGRRRRYPHRPGHQPPCM